MLKLFIMAVALSTALPAHSAKDDGKAKILVMLKTNPVVVAAVNQAKRFARTKKCEYFISASPETQFEPGSAYSFDASITCQGDGSTGAVNVTGTWLSSTKDSQALRLSLDFAD